MNLIFFDTETNGLPLKWGVPFTQVNNYPRIIQFAYQVVNEKGEVIKDFKELVKPDGWEIPNEKFWIDNGYSTEINNDLGKPLFEIIEEFNEFVNLSAGIIAHNMNFDANVLGAEMVRSGQRAKVKLPKYCTMLSAIDFCGLPNPKGRGFKYPKLEELYLKLFNDTFEGAHDAGNDVEACKKCYYGLIEEGVEIVTI